MMVQDPAPRKPGPRPKSSGNRGNVAALIAVAVLAVAIFWIGSAIQNHNAVQNCLDSGRHDCVALPTSP